MLGTSAFNSNFSGNGSFASRQIFNGCPMGIIAMQPGS